MAAYHGRTGEIEVGAAVAVGEVTAWTYNETSDEIEAPAMQQSSKVYHAGLIDGSGTVTVNWDQSDTGQGNLDATGSSAILTLYPYGNSSGNPKLSGTVIITGQEMGADASGVVQRTFTFRNGLTLTTVP